MSQNTSVLAMNVASAAGFLSYEFETEILLSEHALVFLHGLGHQQPPSFVTGAADLAPIADELLTCARLSQSSRVSHANARQVLPSKRPCRPASVAPAMGHRFGLLQCSR